MAATKNAPIVSTARFAQASTESASVNVGGEIFQAKRPKFATTARIAQICAGLDEESATQAEVFDGTLEVARIICLGLFGRSTAERIIEMMYDSECEDVTIETLIALFFFLVSDEEGPQWGKSEAKDHGSGPKPRTIPVQKTTSKKTPAKRATKRPA
ncbi:hypothetical protein ABT282_31070 [Streptomyces sp. NPDC000927]|uniref:hypothetical protein n=1 Tax=Streptomyces sp. NPDC000927 TaxID=3154371 RepID=UPI00331AC28B